MKHLKAGVLALALASTILAGCGGSDSVIETTTIKPLPNILLIGHRGAPAYFPEHTLASYTKAIELGADVIEPDLVRTKDGEFVARHENEISGTTDVANHAEFANRKATKTIDGTAITGWFTEDFTLAELKTLRAKERIPQLRPNNTQYDGKYEIPTLQEVINLAKAKSKETGRTIAIYPETKHPGYFAGIGLAMEEKLVEVLNKNDYKDASAPVFIQSFEVANLKKLKSLTKVRLVQLFGGASGKPYDFVLAGDSRTYGDLTKPAALKEIATYAQGIGPDKSLIIPRAANNQLGTPTSLVADAHAAGLIVHPYTFRPENYFLPAELQVGTDPLAKGKAVEEITAFLKTGIDGFFNDDPANGRAAIDAFVKK